MSAWSRSRVFRYAAWGFLLGAALTAGGYLVDYHNLYGRLPPSLGIGVLRGLHAVSPVHYFADMFALVLALAGGVAGWLQDRVVFYSSRLEEVVEERTRDLARSKERYALAAEGSHDGIWDWNLASDEVYYSGRWRRMIGGGDEIGMTPGAWLDRVHPDDRLRVEEAIRAHVEGATSHMQVDYRMLCDGGSYRWMQARGALVRDAAGRPARMAGSQTDIHERHLAEEQLRHLALHDALTGLANRTVLLDRMERIVAKRRRRDVKVAVLHIGLDRFKKVNESLGQLVGDRVLVEAARRLSQAVADLMAAAPSPDMTGSVFRFEGDEFVVVLEDVRTLRDATRLANRLLKLHEGPFGLDEHDVIVSLSIGIAFGSARSSGPAEILRDAQTSMHRAKVQGRARVEVFDRRMLESVQDAIHLETELFQALEARHLCVWYQPIFDLGSRSLAGFEALVRWEHPERGFIPPAQFIPLAEETGLIVKLSRGLFEQAITQLCAWTERYGDQPGVALSLNLSPKWLFHPDLESDLGALLSESGADPSRIDLEITETSFIDEPKAVAEIVGRLKDRGFGIALDDFGTGYSSLSMLHELPIDTLKIDQRFVAELSTERAVAKIVRTIVDLGRALGLAVTAEGIETERQLRALRSMGCTYGQGYLLGRPMRLEDAERLLEASSRKTVRA